MNESRSANTCWRLREGEFDEPRGIVVWAGRASELDRSCRAIFALLLRNAGAALTKEELLKAGWPGTTVHENSLAKAIGRLREVLGDGGNCLKAVYGVGYRLDAALLAQPEPPRQPPREEASAPIPPSAGRLPWLAPAAGFALLALAAIGIAQWRTQPAADADQQFRATAPIIADAPDAKGRILWVDDHPENNIYEKRLFEQNHLAVHSVTNSVDALRLLAMYRYDVVISDMGRGEDRLAGPKLVEQMRARGDRTPAIIYTVRAGDAAGQQAQRDVVSEAGAQGIAVTPQEVRAIVLRAFGSSSASVPE